MGAAPYYNLAWLKPSEMTPDAEHLHTCSPAEIEAGVAPMLFQPLSSAAYLQLARYLQLLTHWNQKMNLTALRDPRVLIRLHLAECLRAAQRIPSSVDTVLDYGSGAGFPGIPIQIARPELQVTLAESQKKKAAFLREVVRQLGLGAATVYAGRIEDLREATVFDLVTLRAVDKMGEALQSAYARLRPRRNSTAGWCMVLTSRSEVAAVTGADRPSEKERSVGIDWLPPEGIPGTDQRVILLGARID
jgi:16S rRNA (guanine527-N7)-methyltransferase